MTAIAFYYSIGSRYSYLASTQLGQLAAETGCCFEWFPVNSADLMSRLGRNPFEGTPVSGQYAWPYREQDAKRWAALYKAPFVEPHGRVEFNPGLLALACTAAKRLGKIEEYSRALFSAMFVEPLKIIDEQECARRAGSCGMKPEQFTSTMKQREVVDELERVTAAAHKAGVFGVPSFVVGSDLFWGNDRLVLLREHLRSRSRC